MKTNYKIILRAIIFSVFSILLISGCSEENDPVTPEESYDFTEILKNVTNNTIVQTYKSLASEAENLFSVVTVFNTSGTQADLNKAAEAWKAARVHWEGSEGFLFGPVAFRNWRSVQS